MKILGRSSSSQQDRVALAASVLLVFAFLLGGASRQHELRLAVVELLALPVMVMAIGFLWGRALPQGRLALMILAGIVAIPLVQLVPLPPAIWTLLPSHAQSELALQVIGTDPGWLPLSLSPDRTWASFLALLPPVAMFLGILALRPETSSRLVQLLLLLTASAILLGMAQILIGDRSLYLWATTDAGNVVGFFANRNHMATLCLVSLPFAITLAGNAMRHDDARSRITVWVALTFTIVVIFAMAAIRSRTGLVLLGPVLGASILAGWIAAGRGRPRPVFLGMVGVTAVALVACAVLAINPILERFDATGAREGRFENWPLIAETTNTYLPLGSGLGSFDTVFRSVEPLERLDPTFFNQAHNDYLETWLETGWLGAILIIAFMVWYVRRSWAIWKTRSAPYWDMQRAATIAIGVVLLHSFVDYPLRTATMATVFALCCGLLETVYRRDPRSSRRSEA